MIIKVTRGLFLSIGIMGGDNGGPFPRCGVMSLHGVLGTQGGFPPAPLFKIDAVPVSPVPDMDGVDGSPVPVGDGGSSNISLGIHKEDFKITWIVCCYRDGKAG